MTAAAAQPLDRHYLPPGELVVSATPAVVTTILGSCVAVGLWDALAECGGLCHFLLPEPRQARPDAALRFGRTALAELQRRLEALGAAPRRLRAKVFGGAHLGRPAARALDLGAENAALALAVLADAGIPVRERALGGTRGRKLVFHTHDGAAWVNEL